MNDRVRGADMPVLDLQGMERDDPDDSTTRSHLSVVACHATSGLSLLNCV